MSEITQLEEKLKKAKQEVYEKRRKEIEEAKKKIVTNV